MLNKKRDAISNFKTNGKGFSLIKAIVFIATIAVLVVFLVPALLNHIENVKINKDNSTMDNVIDSIKLALSERDVYDEILYYSAYNNVSCYIDMASEKGTGYTKTTTKSEIDLGGKGKNGPQYIYGDEARSADQTPYFAAGNMSGMTITFSPEDINAIGMSTYSLRNGRINKFANSEKTARTVNLTYFSATPNKTAMTLGAMQVDDSTKHCLYNSISEEIEDQLTITSQTYRNSEYTIFICVDIVDGRDSKQNSIDVYGQWNGTNLAIGAS